eukprot:CAMPEP_0201130034 /NCGR_PEP_ID=MMETSP0850-20130426/38642_1 /ASSEMBLY_ACC=CAM_ASM_000622 /TAXON_ID=183588 /ORGANISM="Pseudo-nitzschia fraudulenta, Strain WWA7" /LENGTH=485 /DNA_ID=CAMNT_0047399679 /DNA_START=278 /DNA_END=1735 /DNA_ORIENTATION=-
MSNSAKSLCHEDFGPDNYYSHGQGSASVSAMSNVFVPRLKGMLKQSVNALSPSVPFSEKDETEVATLIFESMYTPGRVYHSMNHVFNITENCDIGHNPILVLSSLFHDIIYYNVDKSFQNPQLELLEGVLDLEDREEDGTCAERRAREPLALASIVHEDPLSDMVCRLFDLEAGQKLPSLGTNEFLSAVIGIRVLSKWLGKAHLMQIAAGIEGTIPFRPASADGKTAMDRLYDRLVLAAPDQSEDWLVETIHLTARMANCDLSSFDSSNFDFFLDSSWSLIPEFRPALLKEDCPLAEYNSEFIAMEGRTKFLTATVPNIFQVFRNVPTTDELAAKQDKTRENLALSDDYAQVRRLQLMILMEIVIVVGEDPSRIPGRPFLHVVLPQPPKVASNDERVRKLLRSGRRAGFSWDPSKCSLGAYLYDKLGKAGVDEAVALYKTDPPGFLRHLPNDVVATIASSLCDVLPDRSDELSKVINKELVETTA